MIYKLPQGPRSPLVSSSGPLGKIHGCNEEQFQSKRRKKIDRKCIGQNKQWVLVVNEENLPGDFSKNLPEDFSNRWCYPLLTCALSRASFPRTGTNIKYHHKKTSKTIKIISWWKTNRSKDLTLRGRRKARQAIFQAWILKDWTKI